MGHAQWKLSQILQGQGVQAGAGDAEAVQAVPTCNNNTLIDKKD